MPAVRGGRKKERREGAGREGGGKNHRRAGPQKPTRDSSKGQRWAWGSDTGEGLVDK